MERFKVGNAVCKSAGSIVARPVQAVLPVINSCSIVISADVLKNELIDEMRKASDYISLAFLHESEWYADYSFINLSTSVPFSVCNCKKYCPDFSAAAST
jgi:hypothetical protein